MWSTPILVIAFTLLFVIYKRITSKSRYWKCISEIPGPKGKPIVGNFMQMLISPENLFHLRRQWAKEYYPIYKTINLNIPIVVIMCPEDIEKVINSKLNEQKGLGYTPVSRWLGEGLLLSQGHKWKSRRRLLTPAFHFSILQEFISIFNRGADNLVEEFEKHCNEPYIEVTKYVTEYTLCAVIETSMGIELNKEKSAASYKEALLAASELVVYRLSRPWLFIKPIFKMSEASKVEDKCVKILHDFSAKIIAERKKTFDVNHNSSEKKKKAMLDLLLSAQQAGADIDDAGIREEVDTFLFAAHDTTATIISYCLIAIANEPHIQEELYKEITEVINDDKKHPTYSDLQQMSYLERCIKETLRLYPSIPTINRLLGEDIKTRSGYTIPKDTNVFISIYDLHRSTEVWENPLKYDPDRFLPENIAKRHNYSFIPFSVGTRNCIGQKYGLFEIKSALCAVLRKFRLDPVDTSETLRYKTDMVLRAAEQVKVKFVLR